MSGSMEAANAEIPLGEGGAPLKKWPRQLEVRDIFSDPQNLQVTCTDRFREDEGRVYARVGE